MLLRSSETRAELDQEIPSPGIGIAWSISIDVRLLLYRVSAQMHFLAEPSSAACTGGGCGLRHAE